MDKHLSRFKFPIVLLVALIGIMFLSFPLSEQVSNNEIESASPTITSKIPLNVQPIVSESVWPESLLNMTYPEIIKDVDLVVQITITSEGICLTNGELHPVMIFPAKVTRVLSGETTTEAINILQYGGFRGEYFILMEGEEILKQGDERLYFLYNVNSNDFDGLKLPENTYHPRPLTTLKVESNTLTPLQYRNSIQPNQLLTEPVNIENFISDYFN